VFYYHYQLIELLLVVDLTLQHVMIFANAVRHRRNVTRHLTSKPSRNSIDVDAFYAPRGIPQKT
jgi:hypothetical protein